MVTFIELHSFAAVRDKYLNDQDFAVLQLYLAGHPHEGDVIPHSGGCRKLRCAIEGRGNVVALGSSIFYVSVLDNSPSALYEKNVKDNIDPALLKRIKEAFEYD